MLTYVHEQYEWNDSDFEMLNNFFLNKHVAPCDQDVLQVLSDLLQAFAKLLTLRIPVCPEKYHSELVCLTVPELL